jgi:copper(I)-binding protein
MVFSALSQAQLVIENARVRAMPPGQTNTAAFLAIKNTGSKEIRLIEAHTKAAKKAEFHSHTMNAQGVMRMAKEQCVDIPAGETFVFKSGGHHIMLMGLTKPLSPGEHITMTLEDSEGQSYPIRLPVVSVMEDHSHH